MVLDVHKVKEILENNGWKPDEFDQFWLTKDGIEVILNPGTISIYWDIQGYDSITFIKVTASDTPDTIADKILSLAEMIEKFSEVIS